MLEDEPSYWDSWNRKKAIIIVSTFLIIVFLRFPFVFIFDLIVTKIGNFYVFIWTLPEALILYFTATKLKVRWTSTAILGTEGIIGIPIDYYYEWIVDRNLLSPWYAVAWGIFFIIMGISADLTLILLNPKENESRAVIISSFLFTTIVLILTFLGNTYFYGINLFYLPYIFGPDWNAVAPIFVPYALATGTLGGYLGCKIKDLL